MPSPTYFLEAEVIHDIQMKAGYNLGCIISPTKNAKVVSLIVIYLKPLLVPPPLNMRTQSKEWKKCFPWDRSRFHRNKRNIIKSLPAAIDC